MIQKLSRIFREYLHKEFNIPARELSKQEIIDQLHELEIDQPDKDKLSVVFEKLDIIKFARKGIDPGRIYPDLRNH